MKNILFTSFLFISFAGSAFASVTVSDPQNHATVSSPFSLAAKAANCSTQAVSAMGYSLDNSSKTTIVQAASINAEVTAATGSHTLHVKAWGKKGAVCVTDVDVSVDSADPTPTGSTIPSSAKTVGGIQLLSNWYGRHDGSTSGSSTGAMNLVSSPSLSGNARQYSTSFTNSGGELYWATWGDDTVSTHFVYDGYVYIAGSSALMGNLEMDMNQVIADGDTVIYGFQCDGWSGTWDFTGNEGTRSNPVDHWYHSTATCNPRNWAPNTWHHVQVAYSRDVNGTVTYETVTLDGNVQAINETVPSAFSLGWGPVLLTNFQVDGYGSGNTKVYLDNLTISRW